MIPPLIKYSLMIVECAIGTAQKGIFLKLLQTDWLITESTLNHQDADIAEVSRIQVIMK